MKNKKLHCRNKYSNPFGGEAKLLYLVAPQQPEENKVVVDLEKMRSAEALQSNTTTNPDLKDIISATISDVKGLGILGDKENLDRMTKWDDLKKEMNAVQNSIDHIKHYKDNLQANAKFLKQVDFVVRANMILQEIEKLESYAKSNKLGRITLDQPVGTIPNADEFESALDPATRNAIHIRARDDINVILENIITDFEKQKTVFETEMKEILLQEFKSIIDSERKFWVDDDSMKKLVTSRSYKSHVDAIEEYAKQVEEFTNDPTKISNIELMKMKEIFDVDLTGRRKNLIALSSKKEKINLDALLLRAKELKKDLTDGHGKISELFGPIETECDSLLLELASAESLLDSKKTEIPEDEFKKMKANIETGREKIKKNRQIKEEALNVLNNNSYLSESLKQSSELPSGLVDQIEFVRKIPDPVKQTQYANLLDEAITHAETQLKFDAFDTLYKKELPETKKQIHDFVNQFSLPRGKSGGKKLYFVSWYDLTRGYEMIKTWTESKMHRRSDETIGRVGEKVIPHLLPFNLTKTLGAEFADKVHEAEHHEVGRLEKLLEPHDIFHIRHKLATETHSPDQLKAVIEVLCKKGAMRWDDVNVLKLLNKFQTHIIFDTTNPENEFKDQTKFYGRLREATSIIWTPDDFRKWQSGNTSAYESAKGSFKSVCNERAETDKGLSGFLKDMLKEVRTKGHHHHVDAMEYEEMISYAIENGKMSPEKYAYYLLQGVDCGLLDRKRPSELNSNDSNKYPGIELWGRAAGLSFNDLKALARIDAGSFEPGIAYKHHFMAEVMHKESVRQRLEKTVSQGNTLDHDDFVRYAAHLQDKTLESALTKSANGGYRLPQTGMGNCTVSFVDYLDMMAHSYKDIPHKEKELARFITIVLDFDTITKGRKYQNLGDKYFRWGSTGADTAKARAAGDLIYRGKGFEKSPREYMKILRELLQDVDKPFFDFIYKTPVPDGDEVQKFVKELKANHPGDIFGNMQDPKDYDSLLDASGEYFQYLIKTKPSLVDALLQRVKVSQKATSQQAVDDFNEADSIAKKRRLLQEGRNGKNIDVEMHHLDPNFHPHFDNGEYHGVLPEWDEDAGWDKGHH